MMVLEQVWRDDEWVERARLRQDANGWRQVRLTLGRYPAFNARFGLFVDAVIASLDAGHSVDVAFSESRDDDKGASDAGD